MVPPVRSRAARGAVPQWRFRRNARDRKGELANPKGLTEGLWVSYRNGITVTGCLLLHRAYNPSASHSLSTSPYTGEARGGRTQLACGPSAGECRRPIFGNSLAGNLWNSRGPPQNLFCGAFVHFPPAESGQKGRRGAFIPKAKCPPEPPVRPFIGCILLHPSPASAAGLGFFSEEAPSPVLRLKRRGFTGGTWFRPSDRARPALRCRPAFPQKRPRSKRGAGKPEGFD